MGRYDADFAAIEADALFYRDGGWQAPLADLEASLDPSPFADLEYEEEWTIGVPPCAEGQHPSLWRVSTEHGTLFLFGSVHFGHPDFYPFPAPIEDAFAEVQSILKAERLKRERRVGLTEFVRGLQKQLKR